MLLAPFGVLFALFFLLPIGYAIYESLLKVHVSGLGLGPSSTTTVFAGLSNYAQVFSDSSFLQGVGGSCCSGWSRSRSCWSSRPSSPCCSTR